MWAGSLIFMMLTMFAIIAVEYLHPLMADLQEQGFYDNCWWCPNAFEDIMTANQVMQALRQHGRRVFGLMGQRSYHAKVYPLGNDDQGANQKWRFSLVIK